MNLKRKFLVLVLMFTALFVLLITVGSYFISINNKALGLGAFLLALFSAFGQIVCLGLYLRRRLLEQAQTKQQETPS